VSIFMDWLCVRDYCRLDSALCHKKYRLQLFTFISASHCSFSAMWSNSQRPSADWMIKRMIRFSTVQLWSHFTLDLVLYKRFIIHLGPALETLQLPSLRDFRAISIVLSTHCANLVNIQLCTGYTEREASEEDLQCIHFLISTHQSLRSVTLEHMKNIPASLLHGALAKRKSVTVRACTILEDETSSCQSSLYHDVSLTCEYTLVPLSLCAYVTEMTINGREVSQLTNTYANLTNAVVGVDTEIELSTVQLICTHWPSLMVLRFNSHESKCEKAALMLIRQLPSLCELDMTGERYDETPTTKYPRDMHKTPSRSQLRILRMYCETASALQEVLLMCPQLTTLSMEHPQRRYNPFGTRLSVEDSLHLLYGTAVRELHLLGYGLSNEDIACLRNTLLHTLSIHGAQKKLTDYGILDLVPTLSFLHTFDICFCAGLTYKVVVPVLEQCLTKRSFTLRTGYGHTKSSSNLLLSDVLPKLYTHVKHFCISC